jgi:hypothetical protein
MHAARAAGMSTAAIGKLGPVLIFDHTERSGEPTIVVDDKTGRSGGIPLSEEMKRRLRGAGLDAQAPERGENDKRGTFQEQGTLKTNTVQQEYFVNVATKVVLDWRRADEPGRLSPWDSRRGGAGAYRGERRPGIHAISPASPESTRAVPPLPVASQCLGRGAAWLYVSERTAHINSAQTCGARSGPLLVLGLRRLAGAGLQAMNRGLGDRLAELHHLL